MVGYLGLAVDLSFLEFAVSAGQRATTTAKGMCILLLTIGLGPIHENSVKHRTRGTCVSALLPDSSGMRLSRLFPVLIVDHVVKVCRGSFDIGMLILAGAALR